MAQVRETSTYIREWLTRDGEPRHSRFGTPPGELEHAGAGAILASLPPGQWGYAWPRDSAYAVVGMTHAGMFDEARAALQFQLDAVTDLYREHSELTAVPIVPYSVSLCRHHGFGVEESDTLGDGDFNFEFDGAGLYLWALGEYVRVSRDFTIVRDNWDVLRDRVAGFLVPLIDDDGLIAADSSIWETHWFGKERHWAYTAITARRGLCDAADLADDMGDVDSAAEWRAEADRLGSGFSRLTFALPGVIGSNAEEVIGANDLGLYLGFADAAVVEAFSMGLFDPRGAVADNTLYFLDDQLGTPDGPGLLRNDDFTDELGLSPWGSPYDASEWVVIDLRRAVAAREAGDTARADELLAWVRDQSAANYLAIGETYDPVTADYTNNAPMVGFGAGAWIAALAHRAGAPIGPACGDYLNEWTGDDDDDATNDDDATDDDDAASDDDDSTGDDLGACACRSSVAGPGPGWALLLLLLYRRAR
jgi:GH15 family glucan-1,4-alpha-glucosidase